MAIAEKADELIQIIKNIKATVKGEEQEQDIARMPSAEE